MAEVHMDGEGVVDGASHWRMEDVVDPGEDCLEVVVSDLLVLVGMRPLGDVELLETPLALLYFH
jgi:hypothetical protein